MGAWKEILIDMQDQQAVDDWCRYECERDTALARRREILIRARQLQTAGQKLVKFFPEVGQVNLILAAQYRAEARQIKEDYR